MRPALSCIYDLKSKCKKSSIKKNSAKNDRVELGLCQSTGVRDADMNCCMPKQIMTLPDYLRKDWRFTRLDCYIDLETRLGSRLAGVFSNEEVLHSVGDGT